MDLFNNLNVNRQAYYIWQKASDTKPSRVYAVKNSVNSSNSNLSTFSDAGSIKTMLEDNCMYFVSNNYGTDCWADGGEANGTTCATVVVSVTLTSFCFSDGGGGNDYPGFDYEEYYNTQDENNTQNQNVAVDSVNIEINSPCLDSSISKITADTNRVKSEITKLYNETYVGSNKKFNLLIQEISATQSGAKAESYKSNTSSNTWEIYLDGRFGNTLTQEKWGSIILHELVHGFIDMNDLDFKDYSNLTDAHKKMLDSWIVQIKETLVSVYGIPNADALALSLEGFDDVLKVSGMFKADMKIWMQNKYQVDVVAAHELAQKYTSGDKGKKCN